MQRRLRLRRDTARRVGSQPTDAATESGPGGTAADPALPLVLPPPDGWDMHLVLRKSVWYRAGRCDTESPQASPLRTWPERRIGR